MSFLASETLLRISPCVPKVRHCGAACSEGAQYATDAKAMFAVRV
jgi:hypothetical protein